MSKKSIVIIDLDAGSNVAATNQEKDLSPPRRPKQKKIKRKDRLQLSTPVHENSNVIETGSLNKELRPVTHKRARHDSLEQQASEKPMQRKRHDSPDEPIPDSSVTPSSRYSRSRFNKFLVALVLEFLV